MSDSHDNTDNENEPEGIKNLRAKAAKADEAEARAVAAERRAAFLEAGVPLSSKPAQALMASYSGELTPDAIKAEAAEWGLLNSDPNTPPAEGETPPVHDYSDEKAQQAARQSLEQGKVADPNDVPKKGGVDKAFENFAKDRQAGTSRQDAIANAFGTVIKAAAEGDSQAIFDPHEWQQRQQRAGHGAEFAR